MSASEHRPELRRRVDVPTKRSTFKRRNGSISLVRISLGQIGFNVRTAKGQIDSVRPVCRCEFDPFTRVQVDLPTLTDMYHRHVDARPYCCA